MATGSIVTESPGGSSGTMNVTSFPAHILWTKSSEPETFAYVRSPPHPPSTGEQNSAKATFEQGRVFRLERNLRYLKSEHKTMLSKLYAEIEVLRRRNKELQYELIVGTPLTSPIEEDEDEFEEERTLVVTTPNSLRESSTQTTVDHILAADKRSQRLVYMEGELRSLRLALDDAETRNNSLSTLISQLKKSHMKMKSRSASFSHDASVAIRNSTSRDLEIPAVPSPHSYAYKFQEYEDLVGRLKRENAEQKQELTQVRTCLNSYQRMAASRQRDGRESLPRIHIPTSPPPRHNQARNKTIDLPYIVQPPMTMSSRHSEGSVYVDKLLKSDRDRSLQHYVTSNSPDRISSGQMHRPTPPQLLNHSDLVRRTDRRKSRERMRDHKSSNR